MNYKKPLIILLILASISTVYFYLYSIKDKIEIEKYLNDEEIDYGTVENIKSERKELDSTIWRNEVLAQKYEESVVALWDSIRIQDDKFSQITNFSFKNIKIPSFTYNQNIEMGIIKKIYSGKKEKFSFDDWVKLVSNWKNKFDLVHVEFHQKEFHPGKIDMSIYNFTFHFKSDDSRYILNGSCTVNWTGNLNKYGNHIPGTLDIEKYETLEYSGNDKFELTQLIGAEGDKSFSGPGMPIALVDLDRDNYSELIIVSANKIYPNNLGHFEKPITLSESFPKELVTGALFGDFNGDGFLDMLCFGREIFPLLFEGTGELKFNKKPKSIKSIIDPLTMPIAATSGDIDNDNDLDVWVTQYESPYVYGQMPTPYYDANDGYPSYLLINDGKGNFKDMTKEFGLDAKRFRRTYSCSFMRLNNDEYLDLVTVNDFAGIDLYINKNGKKFNDVTNEIISEKSSFGMSHTIGDFNLDGLEDLFVIGMSSTTANRLEKMNLNRPGYENQNSARSKMGYGNRMYIKQKNGKFTEKQFPDMDQIAKTGWSWGATTIDFDNDSDPDLYVTNGNMSKETAKDYCSTYWRHDVYTGNSISNDVLKDFFAEITYNVESSGMSWNPFESNHLIMNLNGENFIKIGYLLGVSLEKDSRCVVSEDIDNDGLTDLIVSTTRHHSYFIDGKFPDESIFVFKNKIQSAKENHWLGVILSSKISGFNQVGTVVCIKTKSNENYCRSIIDGNSFRSIHSNKIVFGLGKKDNIEKLEVNWPNGEKEIIIDPEIDKYHSFPLNQPAENRLSLD